MMTLDYLVGHVDHADGRFIAGWLANMDRSDRLEPVICTDRAGRVVEFRAWHMREDVCHFLGRMGRFGFVIPTAALGAMSGPITIRDRFGAVLPGGTELTPSATNKPAGAGPAVIFLHIPKTAGTAVRNAVVGGLLPSERLFLYPPPFGLLLEEMAALPLAQRQAARLVFGHAHFGVDQHIGRPARYATFLREPLARLQSQVAHHVRAGTPFTVDGQKSSLQAVIDGGLDEQFDNLMVRVIAGLPSHLVPLGMIGERHVDAALRNVEANFGFVGLVEMLDDDMPRLSTFLGRKVSVPGRENVNDNPDWLEQSGLRIDWDRVMDINRFDRLLWERIQQRRR